MDSSMLIVSKFENELMFIFTVLLLGGLLMASHEISLNRIETKIEFS